MAQLKDLIVNGATRLIGDAFANTLQVTSLHAPTASNGSTYGAGSNGQVLTSNGTNSYWATIYTPSGGGTSGQYLISSGSTSDPVWKTLASHSYTPAGTVSQPTFTGSSLTSTGTFKPAGTNAKSAVTIKPTTQNIYSMSSAGSVTAGAAASLTMKVENEVLSFTWATNTPTAVTLPGRSNAIAVWTGYTTGVDNTYAAAQTFTGTSATVSVSGTPAGTVSKPTFSGTAATLSHTLS